MENLANILIQREILSGRNYRRAIDAVLEKSFFQAKEKHCANDFPLSESVLSTIAIALSPDGETVATSHGDHTIKVFNFHDGKPRRIFNGHPRTPWTVKYHPTDSNIIASGCLGYEVRIWDIKRNICANMIRLEYSIISLAFHPSGQFIAVASGPQLHTWDWKEDMAAVYGGYPIGQGNTPHRRLVVHSRNIRAVMFHPSGDYVLAAAPDPPRLPQATFTPCRLYAFKFRDILDVSAGTQPIELWTQTAIVPQIHLYSDGGLDISQDGNYILTCAILYVAPNSRGTERDKAIKYPPAMSPISHRERSDADDDEQLHASVNRELGISQPPPPAIGGSASGSYYGSAGSLGGGSFMSRRPFGATGDTLSSSQGDRDSSSADANRGLLGLGPGEAAHLTRVSRRMNLADSTQHQRSHLQPLQQLFVSDATDISTSMYQRGNGLPASLEPSAGALDAAVELEAEQVWKVVGGGADDTSTRDDDAKSKEADAHARVSSLLNTRERQRDLDIELQRTGVFESESKGRTTTTAMDVAEPGAAAAVAALAPMNVDADAEVAVPPPLFLDTKSSSSHHHPVPRLTGSSGASWGTGTMPGSHRTGAASYLNKPPALRASVPTSTDSGLLPPPPEHMITPPTARREGLPTVPPPAPVQTHAPAPFPLPLFSPPAFLHPQPGMMRHSNSVNLQANTQDFNHITASGGAPTGSRSATGSRYSNNSDYETDIFSSGWGDADLRIAPIFADPRKGDKIPTGWKPEENLCIFKLNIHDGKILPPELIRYKSLTGPLMKAVTSAKLSPTGAYALVGYGVRNRGVVEDHPCRHVACEVMSVDNVDLETVSVMTDAEDEVNIAQFHVMCGAGVLYGTKRGKVRVFRRHEYEQTSHIGTGTGIATDYQDLSMSSSSV